MFENGHETLYSLNEWMNLADFLHANTYSRKLKVTLIDIGGYMYMFKYRWPLKS